MGHGCPKTLIGSVSHIPKVSIGLPVYNGGRYLPETLDSLLAQTWQDFEIVVCDNASADQTENVCRVYAAKDSRVRYFRNKTNIGGNRNYQLAFSLARGRYFRWAASDDLCAPTLVERCVEILDEHADVVLAYPRTVLIDDKSQVLSDYEDRLHLQSRRPSDRFRQITTDLGLCNAAFGLIRSDVLRRTGPMGNFIASDVTFLAQLSLEGKFWQVPERLFYRRIHPGAFSSSTDVSAQLRWCNPGAKARISCVEWRHAWEYFRIGWRAQLPPAEKMQVLGYVLRMTIWRRHKLWAELRVAGLELGRGLVA
jgi:glycosyltransferase involved in cell wall biosynthesis